jgi:hypothetical protein
MTLLKLVCVDTIHADIVTKQIISNGYFATAIGRAVVTDQAVGNPLSKIIVEAHAYTDGNVTQLDIECFEKAQEDLM